MQAVYQARSESIGHLLNPIRLVRAMWAQRELITQLTRREVAMRYKGAYLGILWSFLTPMVMLVIYTFVFRFIFHASWSEDEGTGGFALMLFAGIIPFTLFAETSNRATSLILAVPSYVKKVVFPLEILPLISVLSAFVHSLFSVIILLLGCAILQGRVSPTLVTLPLAYVPLIFLCFGLTWFLASLGMYMRDLSHGIALVVVALNFLTPVFYSIDRLPEQWRRIYYLNPLTTIVDSFRFAMLGKPAVNWTTWGICTVASMIFAVLGYAWFMKTKKGFADVI